MNREHAAEVFSGEVRRVMERKRISVRALAETLHVHTYTVCGWRSSRSLPTLKTAARISEALDAPMLSQIVREARTRTCQNPYCGREFIDESSIFQARYCTKRCQQLGKKMLHGRSRDTRVTFATRRLEEHQQAVKAMCEACEPEGVCYRGDCPLRGVSPLPLSRKPLNVGQPRPMPEWMTKELVSLRVGNLKQSKLAS